MASVRMTLEQVWAAMIADWPQCKDHEPTEFRINDLAFAYDVSCSCGVDYTIGHEDVVQHQRFIADQVEMDKNIHTAAGAVLDRLGEREGIIRHEGGPHVANAEPDVDYRERILEVMAKPSRQVDPTSPPKPASKTNIVINEIEFPAPSRIEFDPGVFERKSRGVAAIPDYKRETGLVISCQGEEDGDI